MIKSDHVCATIAHIPIVTITVTRDQISDAVVRVGCGWRRGYDGGECTRGQGFDVIVGTMTGGWTGYFAHTIYKYDVLFILVILLDIDSYFAIDPRSVLAFCGGGWWIFPCATTATPIMMC